MFGSGEPCLLELLANRRLQSDRGDVVPDRLAAHRVCGGDGARDRHPRGGQRQYRGDQCVSGAGNRRRHLGAGLGWGQRFRGGPVGSIAGGEMFSRGLAGESGAGGGGGGGVGPYLYLLAQIQRGQGDRATSAGVGLAWAPEACAATLAIWGIVFVSTRYVSVASIAAAVLLPVAVWCFHYGSKMTLVMTALAVLAIYKHKANMRRLLDGTENRAVAKKHQASP